VEDLYPITGREGRVDHEEVGHYWDENAEV
jgi:hypothetical protein